MERVSGNLTDHYDPKANVIRLSDSVFSSNSVAAVGVAAHEAGHAVQYATHYAPIKLRTAIIPITNIGSTLSIPLVLIGFFVGMTYRRKSDDAAIGSAKEEAKRILSDAMKNAETKKKELLVEAKDEVLRLRQENDKELRERRSDIQRQEHRDP